MIIFLESFVPVLFKFLKKSQENLRIKNLQYFLCQTFFYLILFLMKKKKDENRPHETIPTGDRKFDMPLREGSIGFPAIRGPSPARPTAGSAPR